MKAKTVDSRVYAIADAYETLQHTPDDSAVIRSYNALKEGLRAQWFEAGVVMVPWTLPGQPYNNSAELFADVETNGRLYFYQGGELPINHPLAELSGISNYTWNEVLRAVHDYYGHYTGKNQFGPIGEENAWILHASMFTGDALGALTTETRGQNSWVNYGSHLRVNGRVPVKGETGYVTPANRPYAEQKAGLLPVEYWTRL